MCLCLQALTHSLRSLTDLFEGTGDHRKSGNGSESLLSLEVRPKGGLESCERELVNANGAGQRVLPEAIDQTLAPHARFDWECPLPRPTTAVKNAGSI